MNKQKFIIFSSFFFPYIGGIEKYVYNFSKELARQGNDVLLVVTNHNNSNLIENLSGFKLLKLPIFSKISQRFPILKFNTNFWKLVKIIMDYDADYYILNTRFFITSILGCIIGKLNNKKILIIEHGSGFVEIDNKLLFGIYKIYERVITNIYKMSGVEFAGVSNKCNEWLLNFGIKTNKIVYNGISNSKILEYQSLDKDNKVSIDILKVVFAGRLLRSKGIRYLVDAFEIFSKDKANVELLIIGKGEMTNELMNNYSNNPRIKLLGELSNKAVLDIFVGANIVVIPSYYPEGLPTVLLEAGLTKCAVISTSQGGTNEVLKSNKYGYTIAPHSTEDILLALNYMYNNPDKRKEMADNLHQLVINQFNWQTITNNFLKYINS